MTVITFSYAEGKVILNHVEMKDLNNVKFQKFFEKLCNLLSMSSSVDDQKLILDHISTG